jgi:hypothetical protein
LRRPIVDGEGKPVGIVDVQDWLDIERGFDVPAEAESR